MRVRKTTVKAILIVIIIALLALIAGCVAKGIIDKKNQDDEPIELPEETVVYGDERLGIDPDVDKMLEDYRNILIMGLDTEYIENEENNRSDAIVIVSINEESQDVKMFSVYRDTYLKIDDEYGYDKINHAYAFGGLDLSTYAINTNLDLNIRETKELETEERVALAEDMLDLIVSNVPNQTVAETMLEISEYEITSSTEWPYHKQGWTNHTIYYEVPIDLQKNVSELHEKLFGQEEYIPTNRVLDIKEGIHERTGI